MTGGGLIRVSTTVVVILMNGAVPALPRGSPKYPFSATGRTAHRRFATAEIAPVRCAIHSRVASRRQSPPTHACDHGQRVGRFVVAAGARVPTGATPRRSGLAAASFLLAGAPVAPAPSAGDSGNIVPGRGATGATTTNAGCSSRSALHQPRVARTAVGFRPRSVGPEPAVRFETGQTGLRPPLHPFFWVTSVPVSARTTAKNACAHMAKVMWRYHPVQLRTS